VHSSSPSSDIAAHSSGTRGGIAAHSSGTRGGIAAHSSGTRGGTALNSSGTGGRSGVSRGLGLLCWRGLMVLAVALSLALLPVRRAVADADPASDILLGSQVFYPYQPAVSPALQKRLGQTLSGLQANGLNLKVAIIQSPVDLGALPNIFGKPQQYADFLDKEISFNKPQPLLVVMPSGFGVSHAGPAGALKDLKIDAARKSDGLAQAAIQAVQRIAKANGKSTTGASASSTTGGSGGSSSLITFGVPIVVILLGAGAALFLRRRTAAVGAGDRGDASRSGKD
jgi:hypothetical protein